MRAEKLALAGDGSERVSRCAGMGLIKKVGVFIKVRIQVLFPGFVFQAVLKHDPWPSLSGDDRKKSSRSPSLLWVRRGNTLCKAWAPQLAFVGK